jgi:hypothetical protein
VVAHPPVHRLTPGLSLLKVYTVWLVDAATRMIPIVPTLCARTTGAAVGVGDGVAVGVGEGDGVGVAVAAVPLV